MPDEPAFSAATFIGRAEDDLRTAEILLREPLSPRWPIGFHLQQAAEKAFKALIAAGGVDPPRTHSLRARRFGERNIASGDSARHHRRAWRSILS
jgi:HEPN domain-containing protein